MTDLTNEADILKFWNENKLFEKSLELSKDKPKYVFYDGPPFATGLPHYGHIVASTIKDIIGRYKTQTGYYVERVFGWDTHGLPIEFEIEKRLKIKTKEEILNFGIENYNNECRKIVLKFRDEWRETINRLGRWVDFDNDYKTMDISFMESVWWVFKELFNKDLVYRGVKVMPYSNSCTTPLSNFEATSNYKDTVDPSITVKFKIIDIDFPETYFLVWTTTPWTLPSNLAICVNPNFTYYIVESSRDKNNYVIAKDCLQNYFKKREDYKIVKSISGKDLKDKQYEPMFDYFYNKFKHVAFKIITDNYVESNNGTGLVHIAPAFGKDDFRISLENNIIDKVDKLPPCPLDDNGRFLDIITNFKGLYIKDADSLIIDNLIERGLIFTKRREKHSYPFCWRSNTPLINKTIPCWFIQVEKIKDKIIKNNKLTSWVPKNIRDNKFGKWLENSIDWCVSRNRYWGTPIPIWTSDDFEEIICIGSIEELELLAELPKGSIKDLHRHSIDNITIKSKKGKGLLHRITEVFDCWFESGSMPYAQHGYPKCDKNIRDIFPADFIAEGTDQTRGWFYTLMVLSTALFDKPAFKNVIVNGLVLAEDGEKMSKSKQNYPPVNNIFDKYGADAVRLYLTDGPVVKAGDLKFKEKDIKTINKNVMILMNNMVKYLLQMIDLYEKNLTTTFSPINIAENSDLVQNPIDYWILEYTNKFIVDMHDDMSKYELFHVVDRITNLIDKLSRWYLKLSKNRFSDNDHIALSVLYYCLYNIIVTISPFTPFLSEIIYQKLKQYSKGPLSVHLIQMKLKIWDTKNSLLEPMTNLYKIINLARIIRTKKLKRELKNPVNKIIVIHRKSEVFNSIKLLENYLLDELNIINIEYCLDESKYVKYSIKLNPKLGKIYKQEMMTINDYLSNLSYDEVLNTINDKKDLTVFCNKISFKDLIIKKEILENTYESETDGEFIVMLDKEATEEMDIIYQSKLIIRFLQDWRKELKLIPSDKINIYYKFLDNHNQNISIFNKSLIIVEKNIRTNIKSYNNNTINNTKIYNDTIEFYMEYL